MNSSDSSTLLHASQTIIFFAEVSLIWLCLKLAWNHLPSLFWRISEWMVSQTKEKLRILDFVHQELIGSLLFANSCTLIMWDVVKRAPANRTFSELQQRSGKLILNVLPVMLIECLFKVIFEHFFIPSQPYFLIMHSLMHCKLKDYWFCDWVKAWFHRQGLD